MEFRMKNTISFEGEEVYPSKIVCVGRNYVAHIQEFNSEMPTEPVIFIKPNSSIAHDIWNHEYDDIHYEGEISFLVKSGELVGVGFGLDLTKRDIQSELKKKGLPWERAKAFDRSAVFSGFVSITDDVEDLRMELYINGKLKQDAGCSLMINKPASLIKEINTFLSLEDGDIIMTGTPSGVGAIKDGDKFVGKIFSKNKLLVEGSWSVKMNRGHS
jgi:2-keto-4-pentenoate hydratase/2-oxohepta-3-ene-1,7-dioic acid hydratase in catechol pathway